MCQVNTASASEELSGQSLAMQEMVEDLSVMVSGQRGNAVYVKLSGAAPQLYPVTSKGQRVILFAQGGNSLRFKSAA